MSSLDQMFRDEQRRLSLKQKFWEKKQELEGQEEQEKASRKRMTGGMNQ